MFDELVREVCTYSYTPATVLWIKMGLFLLAVALLLLFFEVLLRISRAFPTVIPFMLFVLAIFLLWIAIFTPVPEIMDQMITPNIIEIQRCISG